MLNDGDKRSRLGVSHLLRHLVGMCLLLDFARLLIYILGFPYHRHTENRSLRLGAPALRLFCPLAVVLVRLPPAKVHFVTLNDTRKNHIVLSEEGTDFMEDEPRGFLCNINVAAQLTRGNAILVTADKVHSHKPLLQGKFGVLKDSPDKAGETLVAMGALELIVPVSAFVDMGAAAERAHHSLAPTLLGNEIAATLVAVEMVDERDEGVEVFKCKSHSSSCLTYTYT